MNKTRYFTELEAQIWGVCCFLFGACMGIILGAILF
jgi:hypothetical protein